MQKTLMLGNEAIARGAWEGGVRVVSSYPGTPSTEITEFASKYNDIYTEWAVNEKVALEVCVGAATGGARALCCMKHVGLNVAADPLFTASYTGLNGGLMVVVADDPGMHSSQNEQDSRHYAHAALLPMLEPADSEECRVFAKEAFALSERFDAPVLLRSTTRLSHARSLVMPGPREDAPVKPYQKDVSKYVMMPAMARGRHVAVEKRMMALSDYANSCPFNRVEMRDASIGVVCSGVVYQYVREALPNASVLKLGMVHPLPRKLIEDFAAKVDRLYVIEELEPVFEQEIASWGIAVIGKELTGRQGELSVRKLAALFGQPTAESYPAPYPPAEVPARPPVMCAGCPHRGPFSVLSKLKLHVTGDIGCYTLGALAPLSALDTTLCMGASIGMSQGLYHARGEEFAQKTVAVIGDSTFLHSGITSLINAVYSRSPITVIILDNTITGMTGHQPNPNTGRDIHGQPTAQIDLESLCRACGVQRVRVIDAFDLAGLEAGIKEELACAEPSVIIARRPCALLDKKSLKPALHIDLQACRHCMMCMKLGCPAIERAGEGVRINPDLCVGCGLCTQVCRFGAIAKEGE